MPGTRRRRPKRRLSGPSRGKRRAAPDLGSCSRSSRPPGPRRRLPGRAPRRARARLASARWLQGFDAPVNASVFSPDGSCSRPRRSTEPLLGTATWRPVGRRFARRRAAGKESTSARRRTLAIAGGQGRVELWDVSSRKQLRELTDPAAADAVPALAAVRYSPDGRSSPPAAQETNHVTLWNARAARDRPADRHESPGSGGAQSISFSPDSKRIAVPGAPGTVGIWDVATGRRVGARSRSGTRTWRGDLRARAGGRSSPSDDSGAVSIVDVRTGRPIGRAALGRRPAAASLDLSPDGRLWPSLRSTARSSCGTRRPAARYGSPLTADTSPVNDVVFSPDGQTLVSAHLRSAVVWDMSGDQAIGRAAGRTGRDMTTDCRFSRTATARRGPVGRHHGRLRRGDAATGSPDRRRPRRRPRRVPARTASSSPSERSTETSGSSTRGAGRGRLSARRGEAPSGTSLSVRTVGCSRSPWTRTASTGSTASSATARCSSGTWTPGPRRAGDHARARVGALGRLQRGRDTPCDRQLRAGGSTSGTWQPGPAMGSR